MKAYKTKVFNRWQKKEKMGDALLLEAIQEIKNGLIDAELGNGLVKKRIPRAGEGKRSSYRTLLATNKGNKWFFIFGFAKNEKENIDNRELAAFKELGETLLTMSPLNIEAAVTSGALLEVKCDEK